MPTRSSTPTSSCSRRSTRRARRPSRASPGMLVVDAVLEAHPDARVVWLPRREDMISFLAGEVGPGDVCISMGCGDIATLPEEVMARRETQRRADVLPTSTTDVVRRPMSERTPSESPSRARILGEIGHRRRAARARSPRTRWAGRAALLVQTRHGCRPRPRRRGPRGVRSAGARRRPRFEHAGGRRRLSRHRGVGAVDGRRPGGGRRRRRRRRSRRVRAGGGMALPVVPTSARGARAARVRVGGRRARLDRRCRADERRRPRLGHRGVPRRGRRSSTCERPPCRAGPSSRSGCGSARPTSPTTTSWSPARSGSTAGDRDEAEAELAEIVRWRRENQPGGQNAGSVFVNPVPGEVSAGHADRRARSARLRDRHRRRVREARQLHPGIRRRVGATTFAP